MTSRCKDVSDNVTKICNLILYGLRSRSNKVIRNSKYISVLCAVIVLEIGACGGDYIINDFCKFSPCVNRLKQFITNVCKTARLCKITSTRNYAVVVATILDILNDCLNDILFGVTDAEVCSLLNTNTIRRITRHYKIRILLLHETDSSFCDPIKVQLNDRSDFTLLISCNVDFLNNNLFSIVVYILSSCRRVSLPSKHRVDFLCTHDQRLFRVDSKVDLLIIDWECGSRSKCVAIERLSMEDQVINMTLEDISAVDIRSNMESTLKVIVAIRVVTTFLNTINKDLGDVGCSCDSNMVPSINGHTMSTSNSINTIVVPMDIRSIQIQDGGTVFRNTTGSCIKEILQTSGGICGGTNPHLNSKVICLKFLNRRQRMLQITTKELQRFSTSNLLKSCLCDIAIGS